MTQNMNNVNTAPAPKIQVSCLLYCQPEVGQLNDSPPSLDPANRFPTQPQSVRSIKQPSLGTLEHSPLLHKILEHRTTLSNILVNVVLRFLQERMFSQRMMFTICRMIGLIQGV